MSIKNLYTGIRLTEVYKIRGSRVNEKSEEHGTAMNIMKTMTVRMEPRGMGCLQTIGYRKSLELVYTSV